MDVVAQTVTVYTKPAADGYGWEQVLRRGQEVVSSSVAGLRLSIDKIFRGPCIEALAPPIIRSQLSEFHVGLHRMD